MFSTHNVILILMAAFYSSTECLTFLWELFVSNIVLAIAAVLS